MEPGRGVVLFCGVVIAVVLIVLIFGLLEVLDPYQH